MPKLNIPKSLRYFLFGLAVFLVASILTLGGVAIAYRNTYYPGVRVGGIDLAGKQRDAGEKLVTSKVGQYMSHPVTVTVPKISEPRNETTGLYPDLDIPTTAGDLGITFQEPSTVQSAWETGHERNILHWTKAVLGTLFNGYKQPLPYTIDQTKVQSFIQTKVAPQVTTPTPAKVTVQGSVVAISDQKPGLTVDIAALTKELANSLATAQDKDATFLRAPVTLADSPVVRKTVEPVATQLDKVGNLKVRLTTSSLSLAPTREQVLAWFSPVQDDKGNISLSLNQDAVTTYLDQNGKKTLDNQKSAAAVVKSLADYVKPTVADNLYAKTIQVALTPKPVAAVTPGTYTVGDYPGKYVEINLKDQRMYLINGTTLEQTYIVSSGFWTTPTPVGRFHIVSKSPRAYSAAFGLYMPYWQNFVDDDGNQAPLGEYGLHGLPEWPNGYKEGENHLGVPVSHGCVRLGTGPDAFVYGWTDIGTPVMINAS